MNTPMPELRDDLQRDHELIDSAQIVQVERRAAGCAPAWTIGQFERARLATVQTFPSRREANAHVRSTRQRRSQR